MIIIECDKHTAMKDKNNESQFTVRRLQFAEGGLSEKGFAFLVKGVR